MAATGKNVPEVAKEHGCTKMSFYRVIKGESVNKNVRDIISGLINKPKNEIWPADEKDHARQCS